MDLITAETIKSFDDYRKYNFTDDVYSQIGKNVEFLMREIVEVLFIHRITFRIQQNL